MFFWITVISGVLVALLGLKLGWFESAALFFNLLIGIYVGVFATPLVAELIPAALEIPYGITCLALLVGLVVFGCLQTITYLFITGQFSVSFPKILDLSGGGLCGFLAGFLLMSYAATLFHVQSENPSADTSINMNYLDWWTSQVSQVAGKNNSTLAGAMAELKKFTESTPTPPTQEDTDPNFPSENST